jgi:HK97 family phage major capsid protein
VADEKLPDSLEGFQAEMSAIADTEGTLSTEQVARYSALEEGMVQFQKSLDVKRRNTTWNTPRVGILPASPKGDDALNHAFEQYMRTGQRNADIAGLMVNGGPTQGMAKYDQTITTTAGGYLIPPGFEQKIVEVMKNFGGIASVAEELPTATGQPLQYPTNDDTANSAEIDAVNVGMSSAGADLVFGQITLGAFSYMAGGTANAALHVPFELAQDSTFPIVPFVSRKLGTRIARKQASDLAIGTGTTMPQGLFDRIPDINLLSGNFGQTAAVNYGQLVGAAAVAGGGQGVMFTLDPDYLPNATWVMRYSTLGILSSITDTTGRPIFQPFTGSSWQGGNGSMAADGSIQGTPDQSQGYRPAGLLIGFPVIVDQAAPAVANASIAKPGAANDAFISFGDHRQAYVVRRIQGITLLVDPYTAMAKRQIGYFAWSRLDAKIQQAKAHVLLAGWNAA